MEYIFIGDDIIECEVINDIRRVNFNNPLSLNISNPYADVFNSHFKSILPSIWFVKKNPLNIYFEKDELAYLLNGCIICSYSEYETYYNFNILPDYYYSDKNLIFKSKIRNRKLEKLGILDSI